MCLYCYFKIHLLDNKQCHTSAIIQPQTDINLSSALHAATILVAMASEKKKFGDQNAGESRQLATNRLKEKLIWKIINNLLGRI